MKRSVLYIIGSIELLCGLLTISFTSILNQLLPKLGRVGFQIAAAGSYSQGDYEMSFTIPALISWVLILWGTAQIVYAVLSKTDKLK